MTREWTRDRRVRKTDRHLREALGSLIHEKSYDAIAVKEILERANVGRSAFYAHFSGKDALLVNSVQQLLNEMLPAPPPSRGSRFDRVVWFSHPLFQHVDRFRHTASAMKGRKGRAIVHHYLRRVLLERVADAIGESAPRSERGGAGVPSALLAEHVVATFILVLDWWVDSRSALSPREIDGVFRSLVLPPLAAMAAGE